MSAEASSAAPLAGVRVLDLSRLLPGPYCTLLLAELGADVVKVEDTGMGDYVRYLPPLVEAADGGVGMGALFCALNRGKRSVSLDLKKEAGREAFFRLAARADVVVESFRPGVLDRLGVGWEALSRRRPGLILCSISGFGQDGPFRDRAGHDIGYLALTGVLEHNAAGPGQAPHPMAVQLADIAGGGMFGALTILAAMVRRAATGEGGHLDVSMADGALACHLPGLAQVMAGGEGLRRGGEILTGGSHTYRVYETSDRRYVAVGALEPKFWGKLCEALGLPELASVMAGTQGEESERARATMAEAFKRHTRDEWTERLAAYDVCVEPLLDTLEASRHALHAARGNFVETSVSGTPFQVVATPAARLSPPGTALQEPPKQGAHTRVLLGETGLSGDEIEALLAAGAARTDDA